MKEEIESFIKDIIKEYGYKGVIVGVSGGIDSAVVAGLCVNALGKDKVYGVLLPERDSARDTIKDSKLVCNSVGIDYKKINISKTLKAVGAYSFNYPVFFIPEKIKEKYVMNKWRSLPKEDAFLDDLRNAGSDEFLKNIAYYRVKHRIRMCYLYLEAEKRNYAVIGTTNKTELLTGFYVKWGDDATDIEPILHLYKTEVYKLARELNIPDKIIQKSPSPDLIPGVTDEYALGMSYSQLDRILTKIEKGNGLQKEDKLKVQRVMDIMEVAKSREIKMIGLNEYKLKKLMALEGKEV